MEIVVLHLGVLLLYAESIPVENLRVNVIDYGKMVKI